MLSQQLQFVTPFIAHAREFCTLNYAHLDDGKSDVLWEVQLLKQFCGSNVSLEKLGYARQSVLAASWFVSSHSPHPDSGSVCLCGEGRVGQSLVRQLVEFYTSRVLTETQWDALSRDKLISVLQDMNSHLSTRIFLTGYKLSLADILLYYGLHRYMAGITFGQKAQFVHVCRWFDQVYNYVNKGVSDTLLLLS